MFIDMPCAAFVLFLQESRRLTYQYANFHGKSGQGSLQGVTQTSLPWASAEIFQGGQGRHFAYHFQVAEDQCSL